MPKNISAFTLLMLALLNVVQGQGPSADEYVRLAEESNKNLDRDSAVEYYEKAAAEFQKLGNVEKLVNSYNQLGILLTRQDKYDKARAYLDKALTTGLASFEPNHLLVATSYISLGVVAAAEDKFDESLNYHDKALKIRLSKLGINSAEVATSYGNIGNVYFRKKDYDIAVKAHLKAMQIREKVFGKNSVEIVESYRNLGNAYREKKNYKKAIGYYEKALNNKIAQLGKGHKDLVRYYKSISEVHLLAGDRSKADESKARADEIEKASISTDLTKRP